MSRSARKAIEQAASDANKKEINLQDDGIASLEDLPRLCEWARDASVNCHGLAGMFWCSYW